MKNKANGKKTPNLWEEAISHPVTSMSVIFIILTAATCLTYSGQLIDIGMFISLIIAIISSIFTFGALLVSVKAMKKSEEATTKSLNATMIQLRIDIVKDVSDFIGCSFFMTPQQRIIEICLPRNEKLPDSFKMKFRNALPKSFLLFSKIEGKTEIFKEKHNKYVTQIENSFDIRNFTAINDFFRSITYIHGIDNNILSSLKAGFPFWESSSTIKTALEMANEIIALGNEIIIDKKALEELLQKEFDECFPNNT